MHSKPKFLLHSIFLTYLLSSFLGCGSNSHRSKDKSHPFEHLSPSTRQKSLNNNQINISPQSKEEIGLRLKDIVSLIASGDGISAKEKADTIDTKTLSDSQYTQLNLLFAQILLNFGEAEQSLEKLRRINPDTLDQDNKINFYQSLAFANSLIGNTLKSANARIVLHHLLPKVKQPESQAAILETLSLLPEPDLTHAENIELSGWMSLAKLSKLVNQPDFIDLTRQWRFEFPDHVANPEALAHQSNLIKSVLNNFKTIAILLPQSGPYAEASNAFLSGFMACHDVTQSKINLLYYDTSKSTTENLYQTAVSEGASLIVGPLEKESITSLSKLTLNIPVLALNHIEGLFKDNLYQFALSPIDEAEQIVDKARSDGHINILTLIPESTVGDRTQKYFSENWNKSEGRIVESQSFNPKNNDYTTTLKKLLNLDESEIRYQNISKSFQNLQYRPRIRQDSQAILLSAKSQEVRMINPLLKFFKADDIKTYAMPTLYSGLPDPISNADLNDIVFCDIPWFFDNAYTGLLSMNTSKEYWHNISNEYLRLFAMGIDTFQLSTHYDDPNYIQQYPGATGSLSLTNTNTIKRKLMCAVFKQGNAEVLF
ncbi:MAG: penicillin-binding protein activator [Methylococcaceae bacterium]|nr:penicillin-binding protein activator [Methylococcaceae bacterium]